MAIKTQKHICKAIKMVQRGTEWMVDDHKPVTNLDGNRLMPNHYYKQTPFKEGDLRGKKRVAVFAGGDWDSKQISFEMARYAAERGVNVDFFYRPDWMPTDSRGRPTDDNNTYYTKIDNPHKLASIVAGFKDRKSAEKGFRKAEVSEIERKVVDDAYVVSPYWNRDIKSIRKTGKTTGYFAKLADADQGDGFFKYLMERQLIEAVDQVRTVDPKNRQILEDRHTGINKQIDYIHEKQSPLKGLKVLFLPQFDLDKGMVGRWRADWPASFLGEYGIKYKVRGAIESQVYRPTVEERKENPKRQKLEVRAKEDVSFNKLKKDVDWADVVVFQRTDSAFSNKLFNYAKKQEKLVGYDVDDLIFGENCVPQHKEFHRYVDNHLNRADFVTASTKAIKKEAEAMRGGKNVFQVKNRLHLDELVVAETLAQKPPEKNGTIRIGWAGSYTHKDKLLESKEVVHRLYDKYKGKIKFVIKGFEPGSDELKEVFNAFREGGREVNIEAHGYTPPIDWRQYYIDLKALNLDVFFAPARVDAEHLGKSELKYLEAAYLGIPVVTPAIGEHSSAVKHGVTGMLADPRDMNESMFRGLDALIQNEQLRKEMGRNAKKHVFREYDLRKSSAEIHNILLKMMKQKGKLADHGKIAKKEPNLVVVSGTSGVGKTSAAAGLAQENDYMRISLDSVREELFPDKQNNELNDIRDVKRLYKELGQRTNNALAAGKSVVVDEYFSLQYTLEWFLQEIKEKTCFDFFRLDASLDELLKRNRAKEPRYRMDERVIIENYERTYDTGYKNLMPVTINTDSKTLEETVEHMKRIIQHHENSRKMKNPVKTKSKMNRLEQALSRR